MNLLSTLFNFMSQCFHSLVIALTRCQARGSLEENFCQRQQFPLKLLIYAYHAKWGVEELYKSSKRLIEVEQFHARCEHGVKPARFANFTLLALTRSFGERLETVLNAEAAADEPKHRTHFKNALKSVARNFEVLMLGHVTLVSDAIANIFLSLSNCTCKELLG